MVNTRGISRAVVLLALIAVALIIAIAVPILQGKSDSAARDVDDLYVQAAMDEAHLRWMQEYKAFSAIYDSENKKFIDTGSRRTLVTPYGTAKEHEGMVLFVKVDGDGNISTKWIDQKDDNLFN